MTAGEPGDNLRLLVKLANLTPDTLKSLREGDRLNLVQEISDYLGGVVEPELKAARAGDVKALGPALAAVRKIVTDSANRTTTGRMEVKVTGLLLDFSPITEGRPPYSAVDGARLKDMLLVGAWFNLRSMVEASRIHICKRPGCGTIFYAERKDQEFCSRACVNRASFAAFQARAKKARAAAAKKKKA